METITCPSCNRANDIKLTNCEYCGYLLRGNDPVTPLKLSKTESAFEQLPSTPGSNDDNGAVNDLAARFADSYRKYKTANEALGAYAEAFFSEKMQGKKMILREAAVKKLVSTFVFALAAFITLSLMMLYHRSYFVFLLVFAVLGIVYRRFRVNDQALLVKKLASMPEADMENVMMSDIDRMISKKMNDAIRIGILAAALAAFLVLFWSPRMIFERGTDGYSLRYYSAAIKPEKNVVLPDTWKGEPVTEIRGNVFEGLKSIRSVVLPNQLLRVRAHAFRSCNNLSRVVFPDTIQSIGSSAFRDCHSLRTVTLPKACSVDERAFKNSGTTIERK